MKSSSIVLATDLSEAAKSAAVWARDMATRTGMPVIAVHVVEIGFDNWLHGRYEIAVDDEMRAAAEKRVAEWYADATGEPAHQVEVHVGHAVHELTEAAKTYDAAMLVMASTGKGSFTRTMVGSRVQQIVSMPPCPVVIVDPISFTLTDTPRIAAAIDFAPSTAEVVGVAGSLAAMSGTGLTLAHIFQTPRMLGVVELLSVEQAAEVMGGAEAELQAIAEARLPGVETTVAVRAGEPETGLVEFCRAERIDVLVLGHTGHWHSARELLGSTPRKLLSNQPCTLVIAPPPRPAG